jgi:predicted Zn-dependent protease
LYSTDFRDIQFLFNLMTLKFLYRFVLLALLSGYVASAWAIDMGNTSASITNAYSDLDMRMRLATKSNEPVCQAEQCAVNDVFDQKVQILGERLANTAYKTYPDLSKKVPNFTFNVENKKESGIASNAAGRIVVFRGVQYLELSDDALSFVLAREMGHVIRRHHQKNVATKILFSVVASILFPAATLLSASHIAAEATTTVMTSVASTVTSFVGSEVVISKIKPNQLLDADEVAIALLEAQGWDSSSVAATLQLKEFGENGWMKDLQMTVRNLNHFIDKANADAVKHLTQVIPVVVSP